MSGKEATVAYDQAHGHFLLPHEVPFFLTAPCRLRGALGLESQTVEDPQQQQYGSPPHIGVILEQHNWVRRGMYKFPETCTQNQRTIDQQGDADEKPDRNAATFSHMRSLTRPGC